jgi:hypothetical protein
MSGAGGDLYLDIYPPALLETVNPTLGRQEFPYVFLTAVYLLFK